MFNLSTVFTNRKTSLLKVAMPLAALLLPGGGGPGYAQVGKAPGLQISVMQPSSAPSESSHAPRALSQMMVQPNLSPVNTGSGIIYTCDPTIASATCDYLNSIVAGNYNDTFINANANIYITLGTTGLGSSLQYDNYVTYSQYVNALSNIPSKSGIQSSALAALSSYDATPYGGNYVKVSAALGTALGFTGLYGATSPAAGPVTYCTIGTAGCYNAIITITDNVNTPLYYDNLGGTEPSDAYDFYATVEHETDEALGTTSCISTQSTPLKNHCDTDVPSGTGTPSAVDLFRYASAGTLVLDSSLSTTAGAYFSYNGGTTNGANGVGGTPKVYNTLDNGDDYADYVASSPDCGTDQAIQDATGCRGEDAGLTILNDGGSEINILTAVGFRVPATHCTNPNPNPNPNPTSFANPGDVNGDCKSDILWQNSSAGGELYEWLMNGLTSGSQGTPGGAASPWTIQGVGDFNADGKSDILWRNAITGEVYIWLMNGTTEASGGSLGDVSSAWVIQAVGDFDGNGKADILWRNSTTGEVYLWLMNGLTVANGGSLGTVNPAWVIQGVGDFNRDGDADILWRNSSTGEVYVWLITGLTVSGQGSLGVVNSGWVIQGLGDFDGDGKTDILWRNSSSGQLYIWLMNGVTSGSQGTPGGASSAWVIQVVGDFNGDGKADILWRNSSTGQLYIWLMNGLTSGSQASPGGAATAWQIETNLYP